MMAPNFDGHDQNYNLLMTGDAFGGEGFLPHLNPAGSGHRPLDAITRGRVKATLSNASSTVPLNPSTAKSLIDSLAKVPPLMAGSPLFQFLQSRFAAIGQGSGTLSLGAASMGSSFAGAPALGNMLQQIQSNGIDDDPHFIGLIGGFFRSGAAKSAMLVLDTESGGTTLDTHDVVSAQHQPKLYSQIASNLAAIFQALKRTPYDSQRSLLDVTTVLFSAEFGRTLRQFGKPIDATGTDHNPLSNSLLIGGKGIRGGLVIGASDFASSTEALSPAHLSMDAEKLKAMGRPFDFAAGLVRTDLPQVFKAGDYLGISSVINTIYSLFGVPSSKFRLIERNGAVAPILSSLLK
ncbi:MAG: DUF1501 domain-containing protein [Bdellovibrionota bacterium]